MATQFFPPSQAGQMFVHALSSAYRDGVRIWDPSLALQKDPMVYELMYREPTVVQAFDRRKTLTAGITWGMETDSDDPRDKAASKIVEHLLRNIRNFREARKHLASAVERGTAFAHVTWGRKFARYGPDKKPRLWRVPVLLTPIDRREFRGVTSIENRPGVLEAPVIHVTWERWNTAARRWWTIAPSEKPDYIRHAYDDGPERLGYGRGLADALYYFWYFLANIREELLNGIEFWSRGFIEAAVDGLREGTQINQRVVDRYVEQVQRHRSRHIFVHDAKDEVKLTQGGSEGTNVCMQAIEELKSEIRSLINHANLNTSANKGGSFALADTQADSEQMIVQADRESLSETITVATVQRAWMLNIENLVEMGLEDADPGRFAIQNQKIQNPEQTARVFQTVLQSGADIPKRHFYNELGIPAPEPGEEVIKGQAGGAAPGGFPPDDLPPPT